MNSMKRVFRSIFPKTNGSFSLNEAINFDKGCIFIAIPKTGTTTVRSQLRPKKGEPLLPTPHLDIMQIRDSLYFYLLKKHIGLNETFPNDKVPTDADLRKEQQQIFESFFKFSAVRNPWARAVSLYFRREGVRTKADMTFEEFIREHHYASDTCRKPTLHRNQLDWLCDENGKMVMDYIYKLEDFGPAVIKEIEEKSGGRVKLKFKSSNVNPESKSSGYREMYTSETREIIAKRFELDIDTFKYTF